jgi:polar amino acid transport system permease protein
VRILSTGYAELFRNTHEYVFLIWVYYVLPIIFSRLLATKFNFSPYAAAVLALGVSYSGFLSETVRAGILAIPRTHIEAAMALGMSRWMIMRRIIAPQAIRRMLPEALNQYVSLFKATSLVSLIAVEDLMYQVSMITVQEMRPLPLYTGAALLYCGIIIAAAQCIQHLSDRWRQRGWA